MALIILMANLKKINVDEKFFVAGATGMAGSAIIRMLETYGYGLKNNNGEILKPNRKELESIICKQCEGPKINKKLFPNTPAEPFWTSQRNWWSPKFFWSVNFFTGHSDGRFVPEKELYVRFVKDR